MKKFIIALVLFLSSTVFAEPFAGYDTTDYYSMYMAETAYYQNFAIHVGTVQYGPYSFSGQFIASPYDLSIQMLPVQMQNMEFFPVIDWTRFQPVEFPPYGFPEQWGHP